MNLEIVSSFKCSKEEPAAGYECAVCLSVFEEGQDKKIFEIGRLEKILQ